MQQLKKDIYNLRYILVILIIYCTITQIIFGTVCPFKIITGINCPGCGLTHATIYLLQGNINKSLEANNTCIFWLIVIALFIIDRYIYKLKIKPFPLLFIIVGIITLIRYIITIYYQL